MRSTGLEVVADVVGARPTEDDNVEQRVGTQTVRTVDRDAGGFPGGVEALDDLVLAVRGLGDDLTLVVGRDTALQSGKGQHSEVSFAKGGTRTML